MNIIDEEFMKETGLTEEDIDVLSVDFSSAIEEYLSLEGNENKEIYEVMLEVLDDFAPTFIKCLEFDEVESIYNCLMVKSFFNIFNEKLRNNNKQLSDIMNNEEIMSKIKEFYKETMKEYLKSRNRKFCIVDFEGNELENNGVTAEENAVKMTSSQFSFFGSKILNVLIRNKVIGEDKVDGVTDVNNELDMILLGVYMKRPDEIIKVIENKIYEMGDIEEIKEEVKASLDMIKESNENKFIFVSYVLDKNFDEDKLSSELRLNISPEAIEFFKKLRIEFLGKYKKVEEAMIFAQNHAPGFSVFC